MLSLPPLPPTHTVPTPVQNRKEKRKNKGMLGQETTYLRNKTHWWYELLRGEPTARLIINISGLSRPRSALRICPGTGWSPHTWLLTESGGVRNGSECKQLLLPYRIFDGPTDLPMLKPMFFCLLGGTLPLCFVPNVCCSIPAFTFRTELLNHF